MEGVRSPSPKIYDYYLKNIFPNMLPKTFSDFISDMGVTDHRQHSMDTKIDNIENKDL